MNKQETIIEKQQRKLPTYYPLMYRDGFTPEEVMTAFRKKMYSDIEAQTQDAAAPEPEASSIMLDSEVYLNGKKV